jgi:aryl-alcohol dehydrogenase-like predicted oxidoreductase
MTLANLGISKLSIYLLHRFEDAGRQDGFIIKELKKLKETGLIEKTGVSIYTPDEAEDCLVNAGVEVIQVPFNLVDKRLLAIDFFKRAKVKNKIVLVRSIFLQGLFFKKDIPDELKEFRPYREKLEDLACREGLNLAALALRYALSFEEIDSILIGVERLDQLMDNMLIFRQGALPGRLVNRINDLGTAPLHIIDPRQWKPSR